MSSLASPPTLSPRASTAIVRRARPGGRRQHLKTDPLNFSGAPALFAACCFAGGILAAHSFWHPAALELLLALGTALLTALACRTAMRAVLLPLGCAWLLLGMICSGIEPSSAPQTALVAYAGRAPHVWTGQVIRVGPQRLEETTTPFSTKVEQEFSQNFDLQIVSVEAQPGRPVPLSGGVRITLYSPAAALLPALGCGTTVRVAAAIHQPDRFLDPGVWDSRAYMLQQGIAAVGSAKAEALTIIAAHRALSRGADFRCRLHAVQQAASNRLMAFAAEPNLRLPALLTLSHDDAAMLSAMIAGDRTWLDRRIRIGFERTGSFHLLVVSGMHLAIFAGLVFWAARRLRLPRILTTSVTIALSFGYALCTGFGQPVQRSFWMVTLFLIARLLWREKNALNAIGFAALCLLAATPRSLFDAGFQMTLLSVIAVAGIAAPVAERTFAPWLRATKTLSEVALDSTLPPRIAQFRVGLRMIADHLQPLLGARLSGWVAPAFLRVTLRAAELLLVSATIELVMSLPMAVYFHRITVLALPVNFLIVPLIGLLLPAALLTFVTLLCSKALAVVPAAFTALLLHIIVGFIQHFSRLSFGDLRVPSPAAWAVVGFIPLLAFAVWAVRRVGVAAAVLALSTAAVLAVFPRPIEHRHGALEIIAIDVGQGDSLLVVGGDGKTLLIDAGGSPFGPPPGTSNFDIGEDVVSPVLWSRGIRRLDAVALTHAHADHIGGMAAVFANFHPREFWVGRNPHSALYEALLRQAAQLGTRVEAHAAGDRFTFGSMKVDVLAPEPNYQPGPTPTNDDSLVMRLVYGKTSALMEGDAESPSERRMLADGSQLHSDLLKVGHHGSRTSTTPAFFAAVAPSVAVISVGRRNFYGHPRREVLQELQDAHVHTFRTDTVGAKDFILDGKRVITLPIEGP